MTRQKSLRRCEEGAVAVEAAITMTALLLLILGIIQFALVYWNWNTMLLAVEEAGRYTMLYNPTNFPSGPPGCADTLANCAVNWASQNWGGLFGVSCTSGCAAGSTTMTFTASYDVDFLNTITLKRSITVPVI